MKKRGNMQDVIIKIAVGFTVLFALFVILFGSYSLLRATLGTSEIDSVNIIGATISGILICGVVGGGALRIRELYKD